MNDTEGSEWESKIPASAVYVEQDGDIVRLSDLLGDLGGDVTVSWADVEGKPSTFAPAAHTHTIAQVTGLQAIHDDFEARIAALEPAA